MIINKLIYTISLFILCGFSYAQERITGKVVTQEGNSIVGATVSLSNDITKIGELTNKEGEFELYTEKGSYTFEVRFLGYKTHTKTVDITSTYNLGTITLIEAPEELQSVEIIGRARSDYKSDYSFSATKVAINNKELPQAIATVTKELISDRQAFQLADAVKTVSSVTSTGNYNHFNIRGITQADDGQVLNGMRTRQYYFLQPITSHIERVEVIKGPASVTFSSVDPGGTVNMVTKKPLSEKRNEASVSTGSFGTIRATADFTGPLNQSKTLLYRFNAAFQEAKSFRDLVQNNALLITPSISYIPNSTTALNAEIIYSNGVGNLDRGQPIFGRINGEYDLNSTPISLNIGASNDYFKSKELIVMTNFSKAFTDNFGFNISYMKQTWNEDLAEHRTENSAAVDIDGNAIPTLAAMRYVEREQFWDTDNFSAFFNIDFKSDKTSNKLLVGYDGSRWERTIGGGQNTARRYLKLDGSVANFNPDNADEFQTIEVDGVVMPKPNVPHFDLENPSNGIRVTKDYTISEFEIPANLSASSGIYVQNQFKFGKFSALVNLRYEWFTDIFDYKGDEQEFKNEAFIPRIGLTYAVTDNVSVYTTYLEGFQPQSNTVSLSPATEGFFWAASPAVFDPLESNLKEIGIKAEFLNGKAILNMAVFDITQKNLLMGDTYDIENLTARGEQRSKGFETDFTGYILPNFQVIASYAFTDAEIVEDDDESLIGERVGGTPKHSANFWGRYDVLGSTLKGLGVGLGLQYSGDKYSWYSDRLLLPEYTVFDGAVYYKPANTNIQLTLKVNNIFDKTYWAGALSSFRLAPGSPRNILLNATYKF
ncbi:TonB-dependent siderophore receptor [Abyssalbus ytuae]|uniref:TonB-dependent receptor n=1 Tax=Abyssalbus ytuae TaxID=2926907 RepID=A0A9E7A2L0_9FLAO|nr:TonB-dependent siderophore receptor [Abyssalbus ytuae]UOB18636.1 TonB-dependent receptor [Abyssalbus ytuae]